MTSRILYISGKEKKMRRASRRRMPPFLIVLLLAMLIAGGIYAVHRPQWQISAITVSGLRTVSDSAVRESVARVLDGTYAAVVPRSFILTASERGIVGHLAKEFPVIQNVAAHKKFPNRLDIAITERTLWGIVCNDLQSSASSTCAVIDDSGYAYAPSPELAGFLVMRVRNDAPDVIVGSSVIDHDTMDRLRMLRDNLSDAAGSPVGFELHRSTSSEIVAVMPEGYRIIFKHDDDTANALRVLRKVLDEEIKDNRKKLAYIDLRFGNKVFYKLK